MSRMTRVGLLAGATALTVTGVSVATPAVEGNDSAMQAEIQRLSARIAELEGRQQDNWLNEARADEIRGIVHDVLADADTRASLLGSGMTAGYDDGFTIGSADGNYLLRINGQLQTRWNYNYQRDSQGALGGLEGVIEDVLDDFGISGEEFQEFVDEFGLGALFADFAGDRHRSGFENARTKLWFSGHIVNPQWQYMIEGDFLRGSGFFNLLDAYITHDCGNGFSATLGQFKAPLTREFLVDSRYQQAVERSLFDSFFGAGRMQGVRLDFERDAFRLSGAFSNGANSTNSTWSAYDTEYAFTGRAEVLAAGTWDQFHEFRSAPGEQMGVLIGAAFHWQRDEFGTGGVFGNNNEIESITLTADASLKFGAANIFGAFAYRNVDPKVGSDSDQWGFLIQGGYHFTEEWEAFIRYEWADLDMGTLDDLSLLTWGINHYFAGHNAKATVDMGYAFDRVEFPVANDRAAWRSDSGGKDGQFVIRTQLQLAF